ncbi:MAG: alginate lyase family protein [Ignavibacteria bacterium]|nr:alginate lyase family protein [Ignavibacteria bacterium]
MKLLRKIRQGLALPPHVAARKAVEIAARTLKRRLAKRRDAKQQTYSTDKHIPALYTYFSLREDELLLPHRAIISELAALYCNHEFDLLGSGWVRVQYGMKALGTEGVVFSAKFENTSPHDILNSEINPPNRSESARIFALVDKDYTPIDWQIDFKSGYRWSTNTWYKSLRYGTTTGADVKVPWELARMQHFPILAEAAFLAQRNREDFALPDVYAREFRNQILDFIAMNPPRWGVNWTTSMDIGIRAVNWLVTYDLFRSIGVEFDEEFEGIFRRSIYEHGTHIIHNLEYSPDLRGNHYLADVAGLLFIAAYLPCMPETDMWLAFSIQEMLSETALQFLPDGGNFEASVPYHRLSAEMVLYADALLSKLPPEKLDALQAYNARLKQGVPKLQNAPMNLRTLHSNYNVTSKINSILAFSARTMKPNGHSPQIGDNDSGRFYILLPNYRKNEATGALTGEHNDHRELFLIHDFLVGKQRIPEKNIIDSFMHPTSKHDAFPDFGLDVYRTSEYYCAVRCGAIGQRGKGGHAHNDQLSIEVQVRNRDFFVDNGTYLYTPAPDKRNLYRSTAAHNTLTIEGKEQNAWLPGGGDVLFWMLGDRSQAKVIARSDDEWIGEHRGFGAVHTRELRFEPSAIHGRDVCTAQGSKVISFHCAPNAQVIENTSTSITLKNEDITIILSWTAGIAKVEPSEYSAGYGLSQPTQVVRIAVDGEECGWRIDVVG